ncbi:MAG TPA: FAD:protein FMN transferase, partial [Bacteroidetes bacterium]|nr:FAD:protein FMN transferase [Bacteroidota bacterium]
LFLFFASCSSNTGKVKYTSLEGKTMGTYYHIKYKGSKNLKGEIDKKLIKINNELSTYIDSSTISLFNKSDSGIVVDKGDFWKNFSKAKEIYEISNGKYDPTVMPLVNYWGFGYSGHRKPDKVDSLKINKILNTVGLDKIKVIKLNNDSFYLKKSIPEIELDFSSIAKGYGVDQIGKLILDNGIADFLVEIGGEIICSGSSPSGKKWVVGINTPKDNAAINEIMLNISLQNKALATSGNYRNFYDINGHKYSHTINPKTGFPEQSNLLSASIITGDCMTADAMATACMVSGYEWSKKLIESNDSINGILIYLDNNKNMKTYKNIKN